MIRSSISRRGVALVLVMTVVLALSLIATPFVISMLLQERLGTTARYESQAGYGADGVRNYAIYRLMYGVDHQERRYGGTYLLDTPPELETRLDELPGRVKDPAGAIWGLVVQDEQGKLNVRTAPRNAVSRVEQLVDPRIANRKDYLTLYSGRDYVWHFPQRIRAVGGLGNPIGNQGQQGIVLDNAFPFGRDARVRISKPGHRPVYATVTANGIVDGFGSAVEVSPAADGAFVDGVIEVEARHPVNINTARLETLAAVFTGLNLVNVQNSTVDAGTAARLARAFVNKEFSRLEEFLLALAAQGDVNPVQRIAVAFNAVCPTAASLGGSGTVPFCFKSYDVYTVEASASMNNPSGAQVAGRGFREVVSVSPPAVLTRFVESQLDFDLMLALGLAVQNRSFSGYPYGNRVVSFPNHVPFPPVPPQPTMPYTPSDVALKPQPPGMEAYVQPRPADDYRGEGDYDNVLAQQGGANWEDGRPRLTYRDSQEGKKLQNAPLTFPWNQVLTPFIQNNLVASSDPVPGGFEMWFRPDALLNPQPIFDIRENDWYNRLTLRFENNELILTACDGTKGIPADLIDNGAAEVRMPFAVLPQTWHHVSAGWKGTRLGELALLADGFSHPQQKFRHVSPEGNELMTELTGGFSPTATTWSLKNDSWFPPNHTIGIFNWPIAFRVGAECVLYDKTAGTMVRGARGTQAVQHPAAAKVTLWGYSSRLSNQPVSVQMTQNFSTQLPYDRIWTGGATLQYGFGILPIAIVAGDKQDPNNPAMRYVDMSQTDIGVTAPNIMDFPDQGYITIDREVIFYSGRSTGGVGGQGNAKFTGCQRAQYLTPASQHNTGRQVRLWSVAVTSTANYPDQTVLQVDDEWFGPVQKNPDASKPNFWVSFLDTSSGTPVPVPLYRGLRVQNSIPNSHTAGTKVIPTFVVNGQAMGVPDAVTVQDAGNQSETARVRRASGQGQAQQQQQQQAGPPPQYPNFQLGGRQIVGFEDNVSREYLADGLFGRILKFPSGELIGLPWLQQNQNVTIGPFDGVVDEIKFFASEHGALRAAASMTTADLTFGVVPDPTQAWGNVPTRGGLYKIGDEYIGWGTLATGIVTQAKRGWLNSVAEVHDAGDPVFDLNWIPVSTLSRDLGQTERKIPLNQKLSGRERQNQGRDYRRGYVLIDSEVIGFEYNNGDGLELSMPVRFDGTTGLYRGAFGTSPATHAAAGSLVYGIPFRFWDTYKAREFDNTMVYFQWSANMDLANWRALTWTQEIPANDPNIVVRAVVRIDGKGEYWDPPGFSEAALVQEFLTAGTRNAINRVGFLNDAGQFDVRFYFEYKPGSFDAALPQNAVSWKRAPKIKEIRVEYDRPTRTLYHEDR